MNAELAASSANHAPRPSVRSAQRSRTHAPSGGCSLGECSQFRIHIADFRAYSSSAFIATPFAVRTLIPGTDKSTQSIYKTTQKKSRPKRRTTQKPPERAHDTKAARKGAQRKTSRPIGRSIKTDDTTQYVTLRVYEWKTVREKGHSMPQLNERLSRKEKPKQTQDYDHEDQREAHCGTAVVPKNTISLKDGVSPLQETWLILPVVICLFQGLSHASLRVTETIGGLRTAHYIRNDLPG
jgi:hypothetical protein